MILLRFRAAALRRGRFAGAPPYGALAVLPRVRAARGGRIRAWIGATKLNGDVVDLTQTHSVCPRGEKMHGADAIPCVQ